MLVSNQSLNIQVLYEFHLHKMKNNYIEWNYSRSEDTFNIQIKISPSAESWNTCRQNSVYIFGAAFREESFEPGIEPRLLGFDSVAPETSDHSDR